MYTLNKEFWIQVQKEFLDEPRTGYLCIGSPTFREVWENVFDIREVHRIREVCRIHIRKLRDQFLRARGLRAMHPLFDQSSYLFVGESKLYNRQIRLDFLNWLVNEYDWSGSNLQNDKNSIS